MYRVYECVCPLRHLYVSRVCRVLVSRVCRVLVCVFFEASVCIVCEVDRLSDLRQLTKSEQGMYARVRLSDICRPV